jgi:hypothetical protein
MAKDLTATTLNTYRRRGLTQAAFLLPHPSGNNPRFCQCCVESPRRFRMACSRLTQLLMSVRRAAI